VTEEPNVTIRLRFSNITKALIKAKALARLALALGDVGWALKFKELSSI
jgi:hypothetical protein